jgi:hypothetical protein
MVIAFVLGTKNIGSNPIKPRNGVWSSGKTLVFDIKYKGSIPFALNIFKIYSLIRLKLSLDKRNILVQIQLNLK